MPYTWADGDSANATRMNGLPRGIMGYANGATSNQTGISTVADLTSLSVTFTAISTRMYKITLQTSVQQRTGAGIVSLYLTDGAGTIQQYRSKTLATDDYAELTVISLETGLSGSITRKGRLATSANTVDNRGAADQYGRLVIEDIGVA